MCFNDKNMSASFFVFMKANFSSLPGNFLDKSLFSYAVNFFLLYASNKVADQPVHLNMCGSRKFCQRGSNFAIF